MTNEMVNMFLLMLFGCFLLKSKTLPANRKMLPAVNSSSWFTSCRFQSGLRSQTGVDCSFLNTTFLKQPHKFSITGDVYGVTKSLVRSAVSTPGYPVWLCPRVRLMAYFLFKAERTWSAP